MCDIAQRKMKEETVEAVQSICAIIMFAGIITSCVSDIGIMMIISIILMIVGAIGCTGCEMWLESRKEEPDFSEKEMADMLDALDEPKGNSGNVNNYPEYIFTQYLKDSDCTLAEFIRFLEGNENPRKYFKEVYNHYKASARGKAIQSEEQVMRMIVRKGRKRQWQRQEEEDI